ncbi:hypothetical protein [Myxococcus sp. RHSTA-1-4]|uniref:hypothetical protein n=1 Tax=Myxococcus sp. RHSTA-1-4 TaxID=2874601 RepID=UPI001CBC53DA|nr:hypothetical protein [Myxococcus sp. RHSTA-1-4]MBZ4419380.1 hypothetical protein [Myxococcus sp. RHSTA-1-4]
MSAKFRLVQYVPDPFVGTKITIGALVEHDGQVELARAPWVPGPGCIGGRKAWSTMQLILDSLSTPARFDLPSGELSALAQLGEERLVPAGVGSAREWLEAKLLPQKPLREQDQKETPPYRPHRDTVGYRFFEQWSVADFVKRKYAPSSLPRTHPKAAASVSHYVPGKDELLLMEPVVGTRPKFEDDLQAISQEFLAFRELFRQMSGPHQTPVFIAYVLTGGYSAAMGEASRVLSRAADQVVNVDDPAQRTLFLQRIVAVGSSGGNQGSLPLPRN